MSKTAVVAIIGRPSAGKSSFLNAAGNQKISIVSPHPQTTGSAVLDLVTGQRIYEKAVQAKIGSVIEI